ncbi:Integrase core domain protein [Oceanibacterium hippocampi]|uniref:Integrase core domain protein n=1 Tax=Oceanibacterium hippocampi TaxID=745714 RepID=A0A1Y5TYM1_9PROT|nr:Integrase core domain protein [Oceanibacterium hippocampi]
MRYAFIAEHRPLFSVRAMCRCLRLHPSGFYAWLKNPLSKRAREDACQTELIRKAWKESGRIYGYRKLHDDLLDQGETCCPNRVARLALLAGIEAQIGYRRRPGTYSGKPSVVVDNTLDRQFDVDAADRVWVTDITYIRTLEGFAYLAIVIDLYSRRVVGWSMQSRRPPSAPSLATKLVAANCPTAKSRTSLLPGGTPDHWIGTTVRSGSGSRQVRSVIKLAADERR